MESVSIHNRLRIILIERLIQYIETNNLTQQQIANLLGVSQPRISNLIQKKLDLFSLEMLVNFLETLGFDIDLDIKVPSTADISQV